MPFDVCLLSSFQDVIQVEILSVSATHASIGENVDVGRDSTFR